VGRSARLSNNSEPTFTDETFTDEEVLTIYLFGIIKRRKTIKGIYDYTADHLSGWFPELPSYGGYNQRLNRLNAVFAPLVQKALSEIGGEELPVRSSRIVDSMPIMLASGKRSSNGKVATRLANEGYCSSKDTWFHGVKLHAIAEHRRGEVPLLDQAGLTPGSQHDLTALSEVLPQIEEGQLYGDKAFCDSGMKERAWSQQDLEVRTPVKKKKGQDCLAAADKLFSKAVSKIRQPIESLFNWIDEKTGIQCGSKVRSYRGLMVHVFGRLTAAMLILDFNS
jgi:hypothetical protein